MSRRRDSTSSAEGKRPRASPQAERVAAAEIVSIPSSLHSVFDRTIARRSSIPFRAPKWETVSYSGRRVPSGALFLHAIGQP